MSKSFVCGGSSGDLDIYQNYIEINVDPSLLNNYANEDGLAAFLSSQSCSEEFKALKIELLQEVMQIIEGSLTDKQKEVVKLIFLEGKTQNEVAKQLGKHQTTVHKLIEGNLDYNNQKKRYGGALKKIRKMCANSTKIQEILERMRQQLK